MSNSSNIHHRPHTVTTQMLRVSDPANIRFGTGAQSVTLSDVIVEQAQTLIDEQPPNVSYHEQYNDYSIYPNVMGLYDFTREDDLGFDHSGNAFHLDNNGAEWVNDRGGSLIFKNAYDDIALTWTASAMGPTYSYIGLRYLEGKNNIAKISSLTEYSISLWFVAHPTADTSRVQTVFAILAEDTGRVLELTWTNGKANLKYGNPATVVNYNVTAAANVWHHVVFTSSSTASSNHFYLNNAEMTPNVGDNTTTPCPIADIAPTHFTLGAKKTVGADDELYSNPMVLSQIGDIVLFNEAIDEGTIDSLYNDQYGYDVLIISGQSNGVGFAIKGKEMQDVDYTNLQNMVYQYNTFHTIKKAAPTTVVVPPEGWSSIEPAFNPLLHPNPDAFSTDGEPFIGNRYDDPLTNPLVKIGSWKTFADRYVKVFKKSKRKLLLIPGAEGGKGFRDGSGNPSTWYAEEGPNLGYLPQILMTAINQVQQIPLCRMIGMIWNQGENEITNNNLNFKQDFLNLRQYLINNTSGFFSATTPIVMTKITLPGRTSQSWWGTRCVMFNGWLDDLKAEYPTVFGFVDTKDLNFESQYHYDVKGHRKLGERYYKELMRILNLTHTFPDPTIPLLEVEGSTQVNDDLDVKGTIRAAEDIELNGVSLTSHLNLKINSNTYTPFWAQLEAIKEIDLGDVGSSHATATYFGGAAMAANGKVYIFPAIAQYIIIYDYRTDTFEKIGLNAYTTVTDNSREWSWGAIYAPNGKIYVPPRDGNKVVVFNTNNNDIYFITMDGIAAAPDASSSNLFGGTVMGPDRKIYFVPRFANNVWTLDYQTDRVVMTDIVIPYPRSFEKGLYHPQANKMFFFPFNARSNNATVVGIIDFNLPEPRTLNVTAITGLSNSLYSACIGADGYIYAGGYTFTGSRTTSRLYKIDPFTNAATASVNLPFADPPTNNYAFDVVSVFSHCDGHIYFVAANHASLWRINPNSTDFSVADPDPFQDLGDVENGYHWVLGFDGSPGSPTTKINGAIHLPDGRILLTPNHGTSLFVLKPSGPAKYPNWMVDPVNNHS